METTISRVTQTHSFVHTHTVVVMLARQSLSMPSRWRMVISVLPFSMRWRQ